mgnify:CR=1 FL=1
MMKEILFVIVVFMANIVEGITGFAGTMLAMPVSMLLIGVEEAKVVLNIVAIIVSLNIAARSWREMNRKEVVKITGFMLIGIVVGIYLFSVLPSGVLMKIYGALIICVAIRGLAVKKEMKISDGGLIGVLFLAGVIHGMFLSGGALLVIYAVNALKEKSVIRATLAPVWIILNTLMLIQGGISGQVTGKMMGLTGVCVIPVFAAIIIGNALHKRIRQEVFVKLTYVLLVVSGITLLV